MASNSEANLSSDFDIDDINWDEQNYSSKGIEFQLPQLALPSDAKTSQNTTVTLPNLNAAVATSQQTSLQSAQNAGSFYSSFFGAANNPSVVRNSKSHGFPPQQTLVSPNALSFPTENFNIPSINTPSSNSSLLQFSPNLVGQNTSLASQLCVPPLQDVQSSGNLMNEDVSPFTDGIDDGTDVIDKIVDQLMERQNSVTESPSLSSSYDDDTPVITYSNQPAIAPNVQLSNSISPQNTQSRSVLSPNIPSRNVTSPNLPTQSVSSPNAPTQTVQSLVNPSQNILSSTSSSRNVPVQNIPSTKILLPNITPSQNAPSPGGLPHSGTRTYSPVQGLSSQAPDQGISPLQTHSKFRLQTPASVPSSMVHTLGQSSIKTSLVTSGKPSVTNLPISLGQTELSTFQANTSQTSQRSNQSYPSFMLQSPNQRLIRQTSSTNFTPNTNATSKPTWLQSNNSLDDLLRMQRSVRNLSPNLDQIQFTNQLLRSTSVLTNKIGTEQSQSNVPSFITTNNGKERSAAHVSPFFTDVVGETLTSDSLLQISSTSSPSPGENSATSINLAAPNIDISQYNRTSDSNPKSVMDQLQTSASQSISYPVQIVSNFSSDSVSSGGQASKIQDTSIGQDVSDLHEALEPTRPLSPHPSQETVSSANQFFLQNFSAVNQSTAEMNRQTSINVSQPQNTISNSLTSGKPVVTSETPSKPQQSKSVFTLIVPPVTTLAQTNPQSQKTSMNSPVLFSVKNSVNSSQPTGITTIKITSPSVNTTGFFKYPPVGLSRHPAPKAVSIQAPRTTAIRLKSPANVTTSAFPTFRLTSPNIGTSASSPNARKMVFTLAPGSQAAASLKNLPANLKDKLTGRQVIFLQQPSGQPINTPKQQPMKIIFVSDGSIGQVVSGPVKTKMTQPSTHPVGSQNPGLAVSSKMPQLSAESKSVPIAVAESSSIQDFDAGSPSSVNSTDSDSVSIAALKQSETFRKQENENKDTTEHKTRGRKRRKDPNRPVKPLSSFQRFFQATQPTIRQQNPQATFAEVSKTIKEMWEHLPTKDKKVYQDAWRMDRVQYKKAMSDYTTSLSEIESDEPSPKHAKNIVIEIKDETDNPGPVDIPMKTENKASPAVRTPISPTVSSSTVASSLPAPRSTGKPLAMMAELANKTKMASAQAAAAAKATGMTKSLHVSKSKASNGIEEGVSLVNKKKAKINPLPKKSCIRAHCNKPAKTTKERGTMFCSDDCVMRHCRGIFKSWVETRRQTLKAAT